MTRIAFTGTRHGMTDEQKEQVRKLFMRYTITELHHGDCMGADMDAHDIAQSLLLRPRIHVHPSDNGNTRAHCKGATYTYRPGNPNRRNMDIVNACSIVVATPQTMYEINRSGTWHAVRYARRQARHILIVWPTGAVTVEAGDYV